MLKIRRRIAVELVFNMNRYEFSFHKLLKTPREIEELIRYLIEPGFKFTTKDVIPEAARSQVYLLRGALAYGIL